MQRKRAVMLPPLLFHYCPTVTGFVLIAFVVCHELFPSHFFFSLQSCCSLAPAHLFLAVALQLTSCGPLFFPRRWNGWLGSTTSRQTGRISCIASTKMCHTQHHRQVASSIHCGYIGILVAGSAHFFFVMHYREGR